MKGSLILSWIIVLVLMLRPVIYGMEMVQAAEERKYENRKVKEMAPACDEKECQVECENDGFLEGRCFGDACVCFEMKKGGAEKAEKRQLNKYHPDCTADPECAAACKKDGFSESLAGLRSDIMSSDQFSKTSKCLKNIIL